MRKFFTFVILALVAVSVWGTEYTIGDGTAVCYNSPLTTGVYYKCFTQQLYLASELTAAGASAGTINALYFQSETYETATGYSPTTRTDFKVYITTTSNNTLTSFVTEKGTEVFSSTSLSIPKGEKFVGTLSTAFPWNGTDNIIVTVVDNSNVRIGGILGATKKGFKAFTISNRGVYFADPNSSGDIDLSSSTSPLNEIPIIIFNIEGSTPSPSISTSTDALDFDSYYPAGETVSQTFKVTASNLTEDITLATTANGVTISPTSIEKDNADLAGDGVEVTVTLGSGYTFTSGTKLSITSDGASTKEIALKATEVRDDDFTDALAISFVNSVGTYYNIGSATIKTIEGNSMTFNGATYSADFTAIAGQESYAATGKFTNLKGKLVAENLFKIFSYGSYSGPTKPTIVMEETSDNSTEILAIEDGTEMGSVTIKRTFATNQWNTLCVPILLGSGDIETYFGSGTQVMAFDEANISPSSITLNFKSASQIQAGEPYLIKPTKEVSNSIVLQNRNFYKTVTPVDNNGIRFDGVLVPTEIDGGDGSDYIIVGANNTLLHPTGTGTIKGMRAYFHVIGTEAKAALKTAKISMNTGSTTEMVLIKDNQIKPYKTMVNDQIVIVNEGKQINILGQIIK